MIKGVIFDADGTLLNSMQIWSSLGERYLLLHGIKADKEIEKTLSSMTLKESSGYLKKQYDISLSADKIEEELLELISNFYNNEVMPKRGAEKFLKSIKQQGIPMTIATSGNKELLNSALIRLDLSKYFVAVLTCEEIKTSKRESDIYLKAAQLMKSEARNTIVFEDAIYAIESAKRGGFITVGVSDDFSIADKEKIIKTADFYIEDFDNLTLEEFDI